MEKEFYKVLLVGSSGKGKTYSFRNMNPESTGFINVEDKPLPFKDSFKNHKRVRKYQEIFTFIEELAKDPSINSIVIDSFSAFAELLLADARRTKKGFDIWNMYNEEISKLMTYIKRCPKHVFVTAHYEILGIEGNQEKRVKAKGKEWEGLIEKEFVMVLYADSKFNEGKPEYFFLTTGEGLSAKCPPDIISDFKLSNDASEVLKKIEKFLS